MPVKTIEDLDLQGKKVLVRVDFNVPLKGGGITDDSRITATLPTIKHILSKGGSVILMSHLGRPKGEKKPEMSLVPVSERLSNLLGTSVVMAEDCIGEQVEATAANLKNGEVMLLENLRYHPEEESNDPGFSSKLASIADVYVNDAFGAAHRAHASTAGVASHLESVAGFLMEKEVNFLSKVVENPVKPFVAIIGGAKVSSKIGVLESLLPKCTTLIIGGGMAYTFLKVQGAAVGNSLVEEEFLDTAAKLLKNSVQTGTEVILPVDHMVGDAFDENAIPEAVDGKNIPDGKIAMDIGKGTLALIRERIAAAKTVVWNGPLGVFEFDSFAAGTLEVAKMVSNCSGTTVVGGGDSVAAVNKFGFADSIDHVSTGGGASLEFLEGKVLPGIAALERK